MANIDRTFAGGAAEVNVSGTMSGSAPAPGGTFVVTGDVSSWPTVNFVVQVDTEKVFVSTRTGSTFTVGPSGRGFDGTPAASHGNNAPVIHLLDAAVMTALVAHVNNVGLDHHSQYLPAATAAGAGLSVNTRVLAVNTDNVGVEIVADTVQLKDVGVGTAKLANLGVTTAKLADNAVTLAKMADLSVATAELVDLSVTTPKLADDSVTSAKIAPATIVASDLAAALRGVEICTSITRPGSVVRGATIYETDTGNLMQWQGLTTGWTLPWGGAWGELNFHTQLVSSSGIGAEVVLSLLSPGAMTFVGNRRVRLRAWFGGWFNTVAGGNLILSIKEGATYLAQAKSTTASAGNAVCPMPVEAMIIPTAGSHTYTLTATNSSGLGSTTAEASATEPAYFYIEDLGPTGAPP